MSYTLARKDYDKHELLEADCPDQPFELLHKWLEEAHTDSEDANAFVLSTVDASGCPSSRVVLLRELSERGISFFTNYNSKKGRDLLENPNASVNFFWPWMERQVRVQGTVQKLTEEENDAYFNSRPRESQIGAWASQQSDTLSSRSTLENKVLELSKVYEGKPIERPKHWGGFLIRLHYFEFWQGRPSRLHDRISYRKDNQEWIKARLNP
ncbi:MAG: pyridoxamine 5'-phosphate oxidase [Flavobacteriales bacterium]